MQPTDWSLYEGHLNIPQEGDVVEVRLEAFGRGDRVELSFVNNSPTVPTTVPGDVRAYRAIAEAPPLEVGETFPAVVLAAEVEDEDLGVACHVSLSRGVTGAVRATAFELADAARRAGEPVHVTITDVNQGGWLTELWGFRSFIPRSQRTAANKTAEQECDSALVAGWRKGHNDHPLVGYQTEALVLSCEGTSVLLSPLALERKRLESLTVGSRIEATVLRRRETVNRKGRKIRGLIVEPVGLEGIELYVPQMVLSRDGRLWPAAGEVLDFEVIESGDVIKLSRLPLLPDPWEKLAEASLARGRDAEFIAHLTGRDVVAYGAFVELTDMPGVRGLLHKSEMLPATVEQLADLNGSPLTVAVRIRDVDYGAERVSFTQLDADAPRPAPARRRGRARRREVVA